MKRKAINDTIRVNGYYIQDFNKGFLGEHREGEKMLKKMGLQPTTIPFSTAMLFTK